MINSVDTIKRHVENRYKEHGYSLATLDWTKGKQEIRFSQLTSMMELQDKAILDIGCGFADLYKYLCDNGVSTKYVGIELSPSVAEKAQDLYKLNDNVQIITGNFLEHDFEHKFDFAFLSGSLNYKVNDNYEYVRNFMAKTISLVDEGFAFDFLSDQVTIQQDQNSDFFNYNPWNILAIAYEFSRNIIFLNNALPFEFTIIVFKDNSFEKGETIFNYWKSRNVK